MGCDRTEEELKHELNESSSQRSWIIMLGLPMGTSQVESHGNCLIYGCKTWVVSWQLPRVLWTMLPNDLAKTTRILQRN